MVRIEQCRPISKRKAFAIAEIRKNKGQQFAAYNEITKAQVIQEENEKTAEFMRRMRKTTKDIRSNKNLITDLELIAKGARTPEGDLKTSDKSKIAALKEKYGIKSWPPQKDAIKLQIQELQEELDSLTTSINKVDEFPFNEALEELLNDEEKANEALISMGRDPSVLRQHTRKNILKKYLWKTAGLEKDLKKLRI